MATTSAFLKIETSSGSPAIEGGSKDKAHLGWIDLYTWTPIHHGLSGAGTGSSLGKPADRSTSVDLSVLFAADGRAAPDIARAVTIGTTFPRVILAVRRDQPGGNYWFDFRTVQFHNDQYGVATDAGKPIDATSAAYGSVEAHHGFFLPITVISDAAGTAVHGVATSLLRLLFRR